MGDTTGKTVTVLTPIAERVVARGMLAPRVSDLAGLRVGLLDNGKPNADLMLDYLAAGLNEQFAFKSIVRRRKTSVGRAAEHLDELAAQCDIVINGVAD